MMHLQAMKFTHTYWKATASIPKCCTQFSHFFSTVFSESMQSSNKDISKFKKIPMQERFVSRAHLSTKIYTKKGDKGMSILLNGERLAKNSHYFEVLGNIDELSSFIGLAKEYASENKHNYVDELERIQCILQDIGTLLAKPQKLEPKEVESIEILNFNYRHVEELEQWIDKHTGALAELKNFILPGGGKTGACLHVCRSVCRRAERSLVPLVQNDLIDGNVLMYLNRLSDYLFTVARIATKACGERETIYIRPSKKPTN